MRKLLVLVSTRSAAIRLAPLILRLQSVPSMQTAVCAVPPQGKSVVRELHTFGIRADEVLEAELAGDETDLSRYVDRLIAAYMPDGLLVHGDADGLMASYRRQAAYGNLGSGLRAYELHHHGTESAGQRLIDLTATHYFVTTETARDILRKDGVPAEHIFVTDSTAQEALLLVSERICMDERVKAGLVADLPFIDPGRRLILVVGGHMENDGARIENACRALKRLAMRVDVQVVYPRHPDPYMHAIADEVFADHPDIKVIEQQDYLHHVYLMQAAYLVLADTGEVQEEALALGKPLLLMRNAEERPQAVDAGNVKLVGTDAEQIQRECTMFLDDESYYQAFAGQCNPHRNSQASQHIAETLLR